MLSLYVQEELLVLISCAHATIVKEKDEKDRKKNEK
jgi:hypothetical protein